MFRSIKDLPTVPHVTVNGDNILFDSTIVNFDEVIKLLLLLK